MCLSRRRNLLLGLKHFKPTCHALDLEPSKSALMSRKNFVARSVVETICTCWIGKQLHPRSERWQASACSFLERGLFIKGSEHLPAESKQMRYRLLVLGLQQVGQGVPYGLESRVSQTASNCLQMLGVRHLLASPPDCPSQAGTNKHFRLVCTASSKIACARRNLALTWAQPSPPLRRPLQYQRR